jgi:protein-L-isoaspartate O-methyltransferase
VPPDASERICRDHLSQNHALPRFFRIRKRSFETAGREELARAYNRVHRTYDDAWVTVAGKTVRDLVERLGRKGSERVFEAGCGSGYGTALLAERLRSGGNVTAADISAGMLGQARKRLASLGTGRVDFILQDAVEALSRMEAIDLVFTTWVLGYIELAPFSRPPRRLRPQARRGVFASSCTGKTRRVASSKSSRNCCAQPLVLTKRVAFDFPRDGPICRKNGTGGA